MKRTLFQAAVLLLAVGTASATMTTQKWTAGWDSFGEPLNYTKSHITWSVNSTSHKLTVMFILVGANPGKLYQVGVHIFCTTIASTFGQFPTEVTNPPLCDTNTKQGVTATVAAVEFGVVTTDIHGNGKFTVVVGPITSGTYNLEFDTRNGAGCGLTGGGGSDANHCDVDFQSPGPFGTATTITVP